MGAMGEEPLTSSTLVSTLAQFHREIVMPEFRREMDALRTDIRAEFAGHLDAMYKLFERLEIEYHSLSAAVTRLEDRMERVEGRLGALEQRLDGIEERLDKVALRSELLELKARVDGLQAQIKVIEDRLTA